MKLLYCTECSDVVRLIETKRTCQCGAIGGHYLDDGLNAVYWGKYAAPVGFNNPLFKNAIRNQPKSGLGKPFEAFVIPKQCPTMKRTRKPKRS